MANPDIDIKQLLPQGATLQSGKYRVVRYLSSGNFGNTYIVENTGMHVQFAMKEFFLRNICYRTGGGSAVSISPAVDPGKVTIQREKFQKEAQRLYGLKSPHLVHVHDMFEENGTVYYVMDFVKGESLSSYMQRTGRPLSEEQTLFILNQLLEGLDEVHSKQIWHLDLKPDNIMIDKDGNVVIIDFGASKQVGQSGKYTGTTNILCYTPGYAPTEQVNQNLDAIGPWTDIYALGATLYNLLTGIDPVTVSPATLQFPQGVSKKTQQLIRGMMTAERTQRPQSIAEVRQLVSAPAASSNTSSSSRRRLPVVAALAGIIALAVLLVNLFFRGGPEVPEPVAVYDDTPMENTVAYEDIAAVDTVVVDEVPADDNPAAAAIAELRQQQEAEAQKLEQLRKEREAEEKRQAELKRQQEEQKRQQEAEQQQRQEAQKKQKNKSQDQTRSSSSASSQTFTANGVSFKMVKVEGGTFQMGSNDSDAYDDEKPVHSVTLSDYYIGETEVTQALWEAVMGDNPSRRKGDNLPVEKVSWDDCRTFISKLNSLTGKNFRLPTEAEWEYAARGGRNSSGYKYSGSNTLGNVAWYTDNSGLQTHPVKTKQANELGLYDMTGNVWEWCQDWYGSYSSGSQTNPKGPTTGSSRVRRGGSRISCGLARHCRVSGRDISSPTYADDDFGLRLAL